MSRTFTEKSPDVDGSAELGDILLFMESNEDRRLLEDWLGQRYAVTVGSGPEALRTDFDLCLLDVATFSQHAQRLTEAKERAAPTFLPCLLVVGEQSGDGLPHEVWRRVDDAVTAPLRKPELEARLSGLLERRRLSKTLSAQRNRMRDLVEAIPDPLLVVDAGGRVVESNPAFGDDMGDDVADVVGSPLSAVDAFPPETVAELSRQAERSRKQTTGESPAAGRRPRR